MRKIFYFIAILSIVSCNSSKKAASTTAENLYVEDLLGMNSEELKSIFPIESIQEDTGLFEEGTEERAYTIIHANTNDELHITWKDPNRTQIDDIRITSNGKLRSKSGVEIGTSYASLNELNNTTISFYGFGWDYSGAVLWNEGKLEKTNMHVFLSPKNEPSNKFYGDQVVEASPEEIKALDLMVQSIIFKN